MSTQQKRGPVTVSNTAELRAALAAGYTADEIQIADTAAQVADARAQARAEGHEAGRQEGLAAGRTEGAAAETQRIRDVAAQSLPGHEALIQQLMFDGKTTGNEAAAQIITAERAKRGKRLEDLAADAIAARTTAAAAPPASADRSTPAVDPKLPVDERCKATWQHDPEIRAEFGSLEEFTAYTKAHERGGVRVLRDRISKH